MTENEAVKYMRIEKECINRDCDRNCAKCDIVQEVDDLNSAYDAAIKALEEVQQYQAIGEVSTCRDAVDICRAMIERGIEPENVEAYIVFEDACVKKGFTIKGLLELREKQTPKKPDLDGDGYGDDGVLIYDTWICPCCGKRYEIDYEEYDYCPNCGQAIDWSARNEDTD